MGVRTLPWDPLRPVGPVHLKLSCPQARQPAAPWSRQEGCGFPAWKHARLSFAEALTRSCVKLPAQRVLTACRMKSPHRMVCNPGWKLCRPNQASSCLSVICLPPQKEGLMGAARPGHRGDGSVWCVCFRGGGGEQDRLWRLLPEESMIPGTEIIDLLPGQVFGKQSSQYCVVGTAKQTRFLIVAVRLTKCPTRSKWLCPSVASVLCICEMGIILVYSLGVAVRMKWGEVFVPRA